MIQFTFTDEKIDAYLQKHFVYEHINVTNNETVSYRGFKGSSQAFARHIGYDFYPTSIFFDEEGEAAFVEVGYIDPEHLPNEVRFMKILKYVHTKSYQNKEFDVSH
jgi:thioredoxin-related protein